ncbi:MAG TPA: DNA mismatch repair protein MutS [Vicinamibacterales bacterium]|jgi:DNA mismatch repair protein MutS|nr:DNA mismatch repair protein MutS [Vicinamibacterales bacterium]
MSTLFTEPASPTPAMRQYFDAKRQYRDAIVFFRMGDFYEMFYEDALTAARALELTLTSRSKDSSGGAIPMCGVPFHAADGYIARLVRKGFRVAVVEQVEDPKKAKGLVRREVVRVVSPGTLTDAGYLDAREPAFLMALFPAPDAAGFGAALLDLSTGHFTAAEYAGKDGRDALVDELAVLRPRELLVPVGSTDVAPLVAAARLDVRVTTAEPWTFDYESARHTLLTQLRAQSLHGFGLESREAAISAAGALVQYLKETQKADLAHVRDVSFRTGVDCLVIDPTTLRNLEIVESSEGSRAGSLLDEIDRTITPMAGRLIRGWLLRPLAALERVQDRLDAVEEFAFRSTARAKLRETLKTVHDIERLVARAALGTAGPRDLVSLRQSIAAVPRIRMLLDEFQAPLVRSLVAALDDLSDVRDALERTLLDEPPAVARDGGMIRDGVDPEIDDLRGISRSGRQRIAEMEEAERARTGISSLKIRYNRVFGYYIEVSKSNLANVPADYHRKQTIAGGERFITPALKEYEEKVLGADERLVEREVEIFDALRTSVANESPRIQETARGIASLDVLAALAETASVLNYTKPQMHAGDELIATDARHPVVERRVPDAFVPNDITLDAAEHQLIILTGPNMGGKSTYLRQTALLAVLAQAGSFVPARTAKLPIVDRVFARVGASDNIARGQSTFMVEMQETANILHLATSRSLVILDEIGRGTATFDGLSLAWAVAEYLASNPRSRPKTIFATHYHELTDLADAVPSVVNFHVVVREWNDELVLLRKVVAGRADRSYGIQVARLAGLPPPVVARAREILSGLERDELSRGGRPSLSGSTDRQQQMGLFQAAAPEDDPLRRRLREVDVNQLTPLQALTLLAELKEEA